MAYKSEFGSFIVIGRFRKPIPKADSPNDSAPAQHRSKTVNSTNSMFLSTMTRSYNPRSHFDFMEFPTIINKVYCLEINLLNYILSVCVCEYYRKGKRIDIG